MSVDDLLLEHAAVTERIWFQHVLAVLPESECDGGTTPGDAGLIVDDSETLDDVIAEFERAGERSRVIAADFDLDDTRTHRRLGDVNLRFIYLLAIEHFARHAGHGDILNEQISHPSRPPLTRQNSRSVDVAGASLQRIQALPSNDHVSASSSELNSADISCDALNQPALQVNWNIGLVPRCIELRPSRE